MYSIFYPITISGTYFVFFFFFLSLSFFCAPLPSDSHPSLCCSRLPLPVPCSPATRSLPPPVLLTPCSPPLFMHPPFQRPALRTHPSLRREEGGRGAGYFLVVGYFWFSHKYVNKIKKIGIITFFEILV